MGFVVTSVSVKQATVTDAAAEAKPLDARTIEAILSVSFILFYFVFCFIIIPLVYNIEIGNGISLCNIDSRDRPIERGGRLPLDKQRTSCGNDIVGRIRNIRIITLPTLEPLGRDSVVKQLIGI